MARIRFTASHLFFRNASSSVRKAIKSSQSESGSQKTIPDPRRYLGVMVSSTFIDLKNHREALIKAISGQELKPVTMEYDSAKPAGDVIDSSLQMVRDSAAYIGVISHKY